MNGLNSSARVLIYSHDRFGLGHLRRSLAIAHGMVDEFPGLSVLILSGSPIIGSFQFKDRVDFVRMPGVTRPPGGELTPLNLGVSINQAMAIRSSIIEHTAAAFQPNIFLVDNVPWGLRGEIQKTLKMLKRRGTELVLGFRDVIDNPAILAEEWKRLRVIPALKNYYDRIWVYGLREICDPFEGVSLPRRVRDKVTFTGYLRRELPREDLASGQWQGLRERPYIVVTTGGGGDGDAMVDWVLRAYEHDPAIEFGALVVFGPFMSERTRGEFLKRIGKIEKIQATTFQTPFEHLLADAAGVITMGGYNTFCEILTLDQKSIIVPREAPKIEQYLRGVRAEELGLARLLSVDGPREAAVMAQAIREFPQQARPSKVNIAGLLDGTEKVNRAVAEILCQPSGRLNAFSL